MGATLRFLRPPSRRMGGELSAPQLVGNTGRDLFASQFGPARKNRNPTPPPAIQLITGRDDMVTRLTQSPKPVEAKSSTSTQTPGYADATWVRNRELLEVRMQVKKGEYREIIRIAGAKNLRSHSVEIFQNGATCKYITTRQRHVAGRTNLFPYRAEGLFGIG